MSNSEHLSKSDFYRDLLGIINLAGSIRNRRRVAEDVLTDLVDTYVQMAGESIKAMDDGQLSKLELLEFIDCMKDGQMVGRLVEYLVKRSASKTTIAEAGPTSTPKVDMFGGLMPRVKSLNVDVLTQ